MECSFSPTLCVEHVFANYLHVRPIYIRRSNVYKYIRRPYSTVYKTQGAECRRLGLTHTFMGEPQRGGRPRHAHTPNIRCSTSVQRRPLVSLLAPVSHLPCHIICPPKPNPTPYSFLVRVEVCRDRHAQKAGCGSRAVAIDSAAVTRAQIPMRSRRSVSLVLFC